eukprot:CAMPEP_0170839958 /NCGR_PEP_ID=MMETSP0734-20130129/4286_1 /TAXON_ID=186038 /ORGANISM="Fragilariopsis kerguelensis, Strain L26-C5" /LENGTH=34 /DNA_ID= /DNA_START= /DNA_END= /DNA_ORIENTATION=
MTAVKGMGMEEEEEEDTGLKSCGLAKKVRAKIGF